jgi:tetratricopeptide (TPR) repeat protein
VAFELLGEVDGSQPDMKDVSALCNLCLSNMRFDAEDGMDLSTTEETIGLTRTSSDSISQTALAGALLNKSKILSSRGQNEAAIPFSAEAVTLLRGMSATRPVFTLFLAHAFDSHAHHLSEAGRKGESYSIRQDAVELWQTLKVSASGPIARPLAWSLFELAKFRQRGSEKNVLREELRIAECAVEAFRGVEPLDVAGLGDALYLFADRMLELDKNREAATYAEESVQHFREASAEDQKYALDLIFSLSLASSCLAYTERNEDALEYAKQAVKVQHERKGIEDKQYDAHLRRLLMEVVIRSMEMNKEREAFPWLQELQALDPSVGTHWFPIFYQ